MSPKVQITCRPASPKRALWASSRSKETAGTPWGITCTREHVGTTSVRYAVDVSDEMAGPHAIFTTRVTFVSVDDAGTKRPLAG